MKQLKVLAKGAALVQLVEALGASDKRFVGRSFEPIKDKPNVQGQWAPNKEPAAVPVWKDTHESYATAWNHYVRCVRKGELWPADKETADVCGVTFDPTFGGQFAAIKKQKEA